MLFLVFTGATEAHFFLCMHSTLPQIACIPVVARVCGVSTPIWPHLAPLGVRIHLFFMKMHFFFAFRKVLVFSQLAHRSDGSTYI